ncbi:MAG: glycosyltransferase [Bacteroidales bacterium]|nr:glycosyltransferase [Bacteroidales bacterium]
MNVSIVTYKTDTAELGRCLQSLDTSIVKQVFIVDNGSEKRIEHFVGAFENVEYIANRNTGYGSAHNIALRKSINSGTDYHLVLNSDVYFEPGLLESAKKYMDNHPDVGQLHPTLIYPDGRHQYTVRRLPTPFDVFIRRFMPESFFKKSRDRYLLKDLDLESIIDVPYHQGSFMLLRVESLKNVGLFDERFFMYPEDIDLTRRMHERYRTIYYPFLTAVHAHKAESYKSGRMLRIHIVNMIRYFNKWGWFVDPERRKANNALITGVSCRDMNSNNRR